jgi:hypothetical protein
MFKNFLFNNLDAQECSSIFYSITWMHMDVQDVLFNLDSQEYSRFFYSIIWVYRDVQGFSIY